MLTHKSNPMETQLLFIILFVGTAVLNWDIITESGESYGKDE